MSILLDRSNRVVVQGITGRDGAFHTQRMLEYGTSIVAGVTPGKGGTALAGVPVFNDVQSAVDATGADTSIIYVPAVFAADAILEAADAGIKLIVCITEGVPVLDMVTVSSYLKLKGGIRLIGPNCPGIMSPGKAKLGILPADIFLPGPVGVVSRSGTLTYEIVNNLTCAGLGQSTVIGIGGDPIIGSSFLDVLQLFEQDSETHAVVMIGEIGGEDEEQAARFIGQHMSKPVIGFIAGKTAPEGKRMGHAGAIVSGAHGTAAEKIRAMQEQGILVGETPRDVAALVRQTLQR